MNEEKEVRERWVHYVEELYQDNRQDVEELQCQQQKFTITEAEVQSNVKQLTRGGDWQTEGQAAMSLLQ
jgi:hypothetical protein